MAPLVKGAAVREFLLWYERKRGGESSADLLSSLPPDLAEHVHPELPALGILASTWYPSALAHHLCDRLCEGRTDEGQLLARDANAEVVPRMIKGIYAVLFRAVASPTLYAMNVDRQWRRLHTTGKRNIEVRDRHEAFSTVTAWDGHHPMLCWITIYTMVYVFHAMGFEHVSADRVECVTHGAKRCATILRYR
jgi:hypothetical protein